MAERSPKALLFALRGRGRLVETRRAGEHVYELDGKRYRCFYLFEKDRLPDEGCWRAEELLDD